MKKQKICKMCSSSLVLVLGSEVYFCNNKKCIYFELFPKGIKELESKICKCGCNTGKVAKVIRGSKK